MSSYLASGDSAKADRAEQIVAQGGTISLQVLNELANVARRKMALSWPETHAFLSTVRTLLPVQPVTVAVHDSGLALAERYGLSIYDAIIAASALQADCETLWSEARRHRHREPASYLQPVSRWMTRWLQRKGTVRLFRAAPAVWFLGRRSSWRSSGRSSSAGRR
ncbi:MAG: PIN domain-containing protein [Rhodospirillales bacterium]